MAPDLRRKERHNFAAMLLVPWKARSTLTAMASGT